MCIDQLARVYIVIKQLNPVSSLNYYYNHACRELIVSIIVYTIVS